MSKHLFLLTRLIRGVTLAGHTADSFLQISTHTPHTRRDAERLTHIEDGIISTHTPHTRRDGYDPAKITAKCISTHTPHTRRDEILHQKGILRKFLLTRLIRGVTQRQRTLERRVRISTHTPHTRRDRDSMVFYRSFHISTHTPHTRRDNDRRTRALQNNHISTHTPHTRRDGSTEHDRFKCLYFYSHASYEA